MLQEDFSMGGKNHFQLVLRLLLTIHMKFDYAHIKYGFVITSLPSRIHICCGIFAGYYTCRDNIVIICSDVT